MKPEEIRAEEYLKSLHLGKVVFEPRGNVAPDFGVGNDIAVEVRRLNQSYERGGKLRGLEEDEIPLIAKIQKLLEAFNHPIETEATSSWFVCINIRKRPIEPWKKIANLLESFLQDFCSNANGIQKAKLTPSISVSLIPSEKRLETFFRLGGIV